MKTKAPSHSPPFLYHDFKRAHADIATACRDDVPYALLVGDSGTGKTTLLRTLSAALDRSRFQLLYFSATQLPPSGLPRLIADRLDLPLWLSQPQTTRLLLQTIRSRSTRLLCWFDEAHALRDDALHQIRLLAEVDLEPPTLFNVVFTGLPALRDKLQEPHLFPLWRRISLRLSLSGLLREEVRPFLVHCFSPDTIRRFSDEALAWLFEQARGIPALLRSWTQECLRVCPSGTLETETVSNVIDQLNNY